ncbi:recombinase family protein [Sphingobium agri]|uniref:Recombinase family protein n=1 Tax=Sphingobium agri TaxID=2933566 RepID=A0ABT0DU86_9SPHN|nr:recombinase family protein [Sphingobium agri]MCK0530679.1 recombinase family protein [Sphingobium agri]
MKTVRCAIYTRKSSEEGLEQDFNSLDAQREACAAYILSQAGEGWTQLAERYDDGGISGGTLERAGLKRLLEDVANGRVDIIVVYKVDRLTRSLLDFAKLVEAFDGASVSFVSVTQAFNTTTSMGRLTLNMLLSFAQFEREVTAERIRDKIAASKAKGMWMGGIPPLGYRPDGRTLAIVPEHAAIVTHIFRRYLVIGNVRLLAESLKREGVLAPARSTATGKHIGGRPFTRGQLYLMLGCRTYLGEIRHHDTVHPGLHRPIIDTGLWEQVQAKLAHNRQGQRSGRRASSPSLLAGLVRCADGVPLVPDHATKGKVRYRYYASRKDGDDNIAPLRLPARELENAVTERLAAALEDPLSLAAEAGLGLDGHDLNRLIAAGGQAAGAARARDRSIMLDLIEFVEVDTGRISICCSGSAISSILGLAPQHSGPVTLISDVRLTRSGRALRFIDDSGARASAEIDASLVRLLARAHRWWRILRSEAVDIKTLALREKVTASWMTRVLRLAFLSPDVTEALLSGRQGGGLDTVSLLSAAAIDGDWKKQAQKFCPEVMAGNL